MIRILLIVLCLSSIAYSEDESLNVVYQKTEKGYVCVIKNMSKEDLLIKDMKNALLRVFGGKEDPFKRGKTWTYLRGQGAGFASDQIVLNVSVVKFPKDGKILECDMHISNFDKSKRLVGVWKKIKVKIRPERKNE